MKETAGGLGWRASFHLWDSVTVAEVSRVAPSRPASAGVTAVLDVLDALDRDGPASLGQLARRTGIAKSTVHRVCAAMALRGWVARDPQTGCIALGPRIAWLAHATPASTLIARFRTVAGELVARHNETTCLAVLDGRDSVFIAKEETTHPVRLVTAVGGRLPAFAAASGRVMLADLPEPTVIARYAGEELVTPTGVPLTVGDLLMCMREARSRGFAENVDETALGLHCVAAPVGPAGRVVAALTICVPSGRMTAGRREELVEAVIAGARRIASSDAEIQCNPRKVTTL